MERLVKQCARCARAYDSKLPFCIQCEGFEVEDYLAYGNLVVITYKRPRETGKRDRKTNEPGD